MTELERARAHLQVCQYDLAGARLLQWCLAGERRLRFVEEAYLAALSWVWDAQERENLSRGPVWFGWDLAKEAGGGSHSSPLPA